MRDEKKTFDTVAFMRRRREELSHAHVGLTGEQIEGRVQQALKDDPLWQQHHQLQVPSSPKTEAGGCHYTAQRLSALEPRMRRAV